MKGPRIARFVSGLAIFAAFLALSFAPGAHGADPEVVRPIAEKLERWDVQGAWADVQALLRKSPGDAGVLEVAANVAFYRGDYGEATRLVKAAVDAGGEDEGRKAFAALAGSTLDVVKGYKEHETAHFLVRLDEEQDAILMGYLADTLERTYETVAGQFNFRPTEKVRVELFPDTRAFYYASTLSARDIEVSGAVGLTKFNKLMFLSPRALVQGYRWLDAISHEYQHYMIMNLSANRAPIWFHEGWPRTRRPGGAAQNRPFPASTRRSLRGPSSRTGSSASSVWTPDWSSCPALRTCSSPMRKPNRP